MRKIFTLVALYIITVQVVSAQTIIKDEIRNFSELAAYELAHPESAKPCETCPKTREADGGLNSKAAQIMPFPPGANIKMSEPLPKKASGGPVPDAPSRPPVQQWLGHLDVGTIIPPDTYGAVGLNHVVTATNNFIKVHNKVGGAQISQVTISAFTGVASTCDPQLFFDPNTQRWIFAAIGCAGVNNPTILMTSNTSDPTGTWRTLTFVSLPGGLLDHPYLGYDDTKIVIGGRKFAGGSSFTGPDLYLINKADMLSGAPITFGVNAQSIVRTAADGDSPKPVPVYFPPFSNTGNPSPGTVYIIQSWNNTSLRLTTVTGNIPTAVWNTGAAVFPTAPGPEAWTAGNHGTAGSVPQQAPETRRLASNDARTSSAVMMNGNIWVSQHCAFPAGASGAAVTHTDVQYWKLDGTPGGTFGNVIQRGRTGAVPGDHRWFSAIAVNKNEDVLVGYSMSNATTLFPSAGYSTRQASTPVNTLDDPLNFHNGESRYWKDFGSGRPRWGDYSQTHLDPVDNSLWTTQQYAAPGAGAIPPDNNSRFGTWWAQVPPSTPTVAPVITAGAATLTAEGCVPNNSVIDPGETVTVSFCVTNTGTSPTVNLVGTMQASGGVTPISGPQNYGVVVNGGPAVCRSFSFSNTSGICGGTITVSIQFQDGATNLGTTTWTFTLGTTVVSSSQNFDGVVAPALPAGWVATNVSGPAPLWVTSSGGALPPFAVSLPNSIFIDDPASISDKQIVTPSFTPGAGARVSFANNYNLESTFDGGVLEISINGGAYQDIITAGGSFVSGGYTGVISNAFGNPLGNRNAWTGASAGFGTTSVNLPAAASGQPCQLKFRMGSDNSVAGIGWRVDNYSVSQPACCGAACTITCPANITTTTGPGSTTCGANVTYPPATTTGLCGAVTYSRASGSFFPVGTTTVTATTAAGPSCTFTVTVTDNTPPVTTCPANISVNNAPGTCAATVNYPSPTVTDNCGLPGPIFLTQTASQTPTAGSVGCNAGGFHTLNSYWRAYNLAPLGLPGPLTVNSVQFGIELADANGTGTTQPVTVNLYTSAGAFPGGARTLVGTSGVIQIPDQTLTTFTAPITVPPTVPANAILCVELVTPDGRAPANNRFFIGSNASAQTGPSYIQAADCGIATPTDLATIGFPNMHIILNINGSTGGAPPLVQIAGLPSGSVFPVGVTTNTFRGTDVAGNTSTCTFTVTVVDNQAPTITCPANITATTPIGSCTAVVPYTVTSSDNCPGVTQALIAGLASGSAFPIGVTTVTWRATDASGNQTTCTFTVTVNDGQLPVITAQPTNQTVCVGSNAVFSVTATNVVSYRWQTWTGTSWVDMSPAQTGATLTIPAVTFSMNTSDYRVIINGLCTFNIISNFATLYVNPLPTISLLASRSLALLPGNSLDITTVVNPSGGSFVWRKNGVVIPGATGSSLQGLTVDDIGSYTATYTDPNGCVATSAAMVVTGQASDKLWLYPNPNLGSFQVRFFNSANEPVTLQIFNSTGQKVYSRALVTSGIAYSQIDVDISNLSADEYNAVIVRSDGKVVGTRKFVKLKN